MKIIHIFLILTASALTVAVLLRIPGTFTPTIANLNTYTMSPMQVSEAPQENSLSIENFIHKLKQNRAPNHAIIAIKSAANTNEQIKKYCTITAGVPTNNARVAIYCRGYQKNVFKRTGNGVLLTYIYIKEGLLSVPCVAFDLPDARATFNNGQDLDQLCLQTVYEAVVRSNPDARITLLGDCRGGQTVLNFVARTSTPQVDTLVLASPFATTERVFKKIAASYVQPFLGSCAYPILRKFLHFVLPHYDALKDTLLDVAHTITNKKIFIGALVTDTVNPNDNLNELITILREHNTVYVLPLTQSDFAGPMPNHSRLHRSYTFQNGVNAFYKVYGIPYNPKKADAGTHLLEAAKTAIIPVF